jgi:hypothetical protein
MPIRGQLIEGHRQQEDSMSSAGRDTDAKRLLLAPAGWSASADSARQRVTVLSASLLQAVMILSGEDHAGLAGRAGVDASVVSEVVGGTCPAWALPYEQFTALADVAAASWPPAAFETAAACDLLLTCVLNGDQSMATDVLTELRSRDLARALLRLALTSEPDSATGLAEPSMVTSDLLALLSQRAAALAGSDSPDAWVGVEILTACAGGQS